jgi:hypothetical protein
VILECELCVGFMQCNVGIVRNDVVLRLLFTMYCKLYRVSWYGPEER